MAEQDQSQKTEEPTAKKLEDARKRGEMPKSTEVSSLLVLIGGALFLATLAMPVFSALGGSLANLLSHAHEIRLDGDGAVTAYRDFVGVTLWAMGPILAIAVVMAILGNVMQAMPVLSAEKLKPKLDKISPIKGAERIFGTEGLVNLAKGLAKMAIVGAVAFAILWPARGELLVMPQLEPIAMLLEVQTWALKLILGVVAVLIVVAVLDIVYQRYSFMKKQRMTKQEVKDERKQMEGDPQVKQKIAQVRMERGRRRMMAQVPEATVVVTNPTHYAIALKYSQGETPVPVCVAKGVDAVALKIREIAETHDIPRVENPPLARALYATVEVDAEVPPEHYKAVAKVIGYVLKLRRKW
jgi:flagellar biosynthetic protein FlhB